jgi:hypothetical protein
MYYAFYAPEATHKSSNDRKWSGDVELRGVADKTYHVIGYVDGKDYGTVTGPTAKLHVDFTGSVLLETK